LRWAFWWKYLCRWSC